MKKNISIITITIVSFLILIYLSFLFVIPKYINFNKYTPYLEKAIFEKTGLQIKLKEVNVATSWDLSLSANIKKADLAGNDNKFAQINDLKIKIALLPLCFKKIKLKELSAEKFLANLENDMFIKKSATKLPQVDFALSEKLPDIKIKYYRISIIDGKNNYTIKGDNFNVSSFILNKKLKLETIGKIILNEKEHINYDIKISSKIFPQIKNSIQEKEFNELIENLKNIIKYQVLFNIKSDLTISGTAEAPLLDGYSEINNLKFVCENKQFPPSLIKLNHNGDKIAIDSILNLRNNSAFKIKGIFDNGKKKNLYLKVTSDSINIQELSLIINTIGKSFGIKELQNLILKGDLTADFSIKSDLKKITSEGLLQVKNAEVYDKTRNLKITEINANIDFSNNAVNIKKTTAKVNSQPITVSGEIDNDANANILITSKNLNLKDVLKANNNDILKQNVVEGLLNFEVKIKGQLKNLIPKVKINITDIIATSKKTKATLKISSADIAAHYDKIQYATIKLWNTNFSPDKQTSILIPRSVLNLENEKLSIEKTNLWINNIKTDLSGTILNINKKPMLNNLSISIPNETTVPLKDYHGSKLAIRGDLKLNGNVSNPNIAGLVTISSLYIPQLSIIVKDSYLKAADKITLSCSSAQVGESKFNLIAEIDKNFMNGAVIKNLKIHTGFVDLNEIDKAMKKQKDLNFTIINGMFTAEAVKSNQIQAENISANISSKNGIVYLNNLTGTAYTGKIAGNVNYFINNRKTSLKLQGRGLSAKLIVPAITERNDDVSGKLDFDSSISFVGSSLQDVKNTLEGKSKIQISNGKMGMLGKLEHFLYAQNVVAESWLKSSLNLTTKALTTKNTGVYKSLKGEIDFVNGIANIISIKTTGPSMSLYMKGKVFLSDNYTVMTIFGRISNDVADVLGPIGEFTMEKALSSVLKLQEKTGKQYITETDYENYMQIPELSPKTNFKTREFRVLINGDPYKQSSVKSFEWLIKPNKNSTEILKSSQKQVEENSENLPDFIKKLPDYKK